ncbi:hypothetical protein SEA_CASSEROLE_50 [Arthrobacter phage Casserole]|nr:hypothetical protein SEA_CASSEROLE_50 [Arthrobacter phage Casserole]
MLEIIQNVQFRTDDDPAWKRWDFALSRRTPNKHMDEMGNWTTGNKYARLWVAQEAMQGTIDRSFMNTQTDLMHEIPGIDPDTNEDIPDFFRCIVATHKLVKGTYFLNTFYIHDLKTDAVRPWGGGTNV